MVLGVLTTGCDQSSPERVMTNMVAPVTVRAKQCWKRKETLIDSEFFDCVVILADSKGQVYCLNSGTYASRAIGMLERGDTLK